LPAAPPKQLKVPIAMAEAMRVIEDGFPKPKPTNATGLTGSRWGFRLRVSLPSNERRFIAKLRGGPGISTHEKLMAITSDKRKHHDALRDC